METSNLTEQQPRRFNIIGTSGSFTGYRVFEVHSGVAATIAGLTTSGSQVMTDSDYKVESLTWYVDPASSPPTSD